ncbi:MAG: 16S rRNA (guanine(966)-N(2))-methyltransferase RsmD [Gemmatimonadetes bacterium]|nr:16S rRNA (guanine(966)-N(2))-methyltransferase RsmD [Gemmatimonadota bacterium]
MRLRIVAGELGGRYIEAPVGRNTRPTAERVREAWFSALGDEVLDARVLDLCAGSGALGIEALSRGARHVHFVESDPKTLTTLRRNLVALGVEDRSRVVRAGAARFVDRVERPYDIALADPPYGVGLGPELLLAYRERPFAGELWLEHSSEVPTEGATWTRRYGDTWLSRYVAGSGDPGSSSHPQRDRE